MTHREEIQRLIDAENAAFREDGINYTVRELLQTRSDRARMALSEAKAYGDDVAWFKVPSGTEVAIDTAIVREFLHNGLASYD